MKNLFVIVVTYTKPFDQVEPTLAAHRAYLRSGYEAGILLASGPQAPKTGGVIIGRFANLEAARDFTLLDPYHLNGLATYQIIEFNPVLHDAILDAFVS